MKGSMAMKSPKMKAKASKIDRHVESKHSMPSKKPGVAGGKRKEY